MDRKARCRPHKCMYLEHAPSVMGLPWKIMDAGCLIMYMYNVYVTYRTRQNFRWLKFSPKAHAMYWDKNFTKFNFTNHVSYFPGSCGWSSRVAMCIHVCMRARMCQIFTVQKNSQKNFRQWHALAKLVKNFLLVKIFTCMVQSLKGGDSHEGEVGESPPLGPM